MSHQDSRLDLYVDVFYEKNQWARVLPEITPLEFIEAILQEFRQARMEFLMDDPHEYVLARAEDLTLLDLDQPLHQQVQEKERLVLLERNISPPPGAKPPTKPFYLRELSTNRVFRIPWMPAIIGRPDPTRPDNALLAVNLRDFETGLRVSRRHAQIMEIDGHPYIKSLSQNPTKIQRDGGAVRLPVSRTPMDLQPGDIILLDRSNIMLKVIIRDDLSALNEAFQDDDSKDVEESVETENESMAESSDAEDAS